MKYLSKKSQISFGKILSLALLITLLIALFITAYYLYLNIPRSPEKLEINLEPIVFENLTSEINQFYPNMKFNHNDISYYIDNNCDNEKKQKMRLAFDELSNNVPIISFYPTVNNPDIEITCNQQSQIVSENEGKKHFVAGEGGAKEIIQTGRFNIITEGVILLYENPKIRTIECDYPNVALHELMHVFGFDHTNNKRSLMYPLIESCDQILDLSIINYLNTLYSQPNLPDLYFEDLKVTKKGRYIDFNLTIKNSGAIDAESVILTILDDNKVIHEDELCPEEDSCIFKFGSGISIFTKNLKLKHLNPDQISFIIDKNNKIKEIDENNNLVNIKLE